MADVTVDLDAYFERIGYSGPRAPTLDMLRTIHALHPAAIPFENLNPLLGWPVPLDPASLEQKLIRDGRGGYCFEQNGLLWQVLTSLGFRVSGHAARILWGRGDDVLTPRSHMLLRVDIDGTDFIADVGFGGQTLTAPLQLDTDAEQETPHELHRLVRIEDGFKLQAKLEETWRSVYRFDLASFLPTDYEVNNYWTATHPQSHFRTGLIAARAAEGRRYALRNTRLTIHQPGKESEHRTLASVAEVRESLRENFRLRLPEGPDLDGALTGIVESATR